LTLGAYPRARRHNGRSPPTPHAELPTTASSSCIPWRRAAVSEDKREKKVPFGNDHRDTTNGKTDDPIPGGIGRVYFVDENEHLLEVTWR
jgi:hypothetical protein